MTERLRHQNTGNEHDREYLRCPKNQIVQNVIRHNIGELCGKGNLRSKKAAPILAGTVTDILWIRKSPSVNMKMSALARAARMS